MGKIKLADDGTLDTVLRCSKCGEEMRYLWDTPSEDDVPSPLLAYDEFVAWAIEDAESDHECEET